MDTTVVPRRFGPLSASEETGTEARREDHRGSDHIPTSFRPGRANRGAQRTLASEAGGRNGCARIVPDSVPVGW